MKVLKVILRNISIFIIFVALAWVFFEFYSVIFSKDISGEVLDVQRLSNPELLRLEVKDPAIAKTEPEPGGRNFSFSISIRDSKTNEIHVATTEDGRWAVVRPGQCVTARIYPYPPWNVYKGGIFFDASLQRLFDCPQKAVSETETPPAPSEL